MDFALTKIQPPRPRASFIERGQVQARLAAALRNQRLVLLCAPGGFGKTVLLAHELAKLPPDHAIVWVAADEGDDLHRLLDCMLAALEPLDPPWRIAPEAVPRLKLKWTFGFPSASSVYGQPTVAGGRVFIGVDTGYVYALDAATGCVHWSFQAETGVRNAISVGIEVMFAAAASACSASVSTFANTTSWCVSDAFSKVGPNCLHGPHHSAQKSTSTGLSDLSTCSENSASVTAWNATVSLLGSGTTSALSQHQRGDRHSRPPRIARALENVAVLIEDEDPGDPDVFGLWESDEFMPDRITIFRRPS